MVQGTPSVARGTRRSLDGSRTGKHHVLLRYRIRRFRGRIFRRLLVSGSRGWKLSVEIVPVIEPAVGMGAGVDFAHVNSIDLTPFY
jgi:hypothetical protein